MAEVYQFPGGSLPPTSPDPKLERAALLFVEIASIAANADRSCFLTHSDFMVPEAQDSERVVLELDRLRDVICRIGWVADLGSTAISGHPAIRSSAESWMLSPVLSVMLASGADPAR